jgi:class 3 adenylate cyclase
MVRTIDLSRIRDLTSFDGGCIALSISESSRILPRVRRVYACPVSAGVLTTFVFADVEGSTAVIDRLGDGVGVATMLRQLDELSQRVHDYGGELIKSTGDGLLITFDSPRQAVAFAVAAQRALAGSHQRSGLGSTRVRPSGAATIRWVGR